MPRISVERSIRVYDDDKGWYVQVGPDPDGLDLCRILYSETHQQREVIIPWPHAQELAKAITELSAHHVD
jgi:hypothetical protein